MHNDAQCPPENFARVLWCVGTDLRRAIAEGKCESGVLDILELGDLAAFCAEEADCRPALRRQLWAIRRRALNTLEWACAAETPEPIRLAALRERESVA